MKKQLSIKCFFSKNKKQSSLVSPSSQISEIDENNNCLELPKKNLVLSCSSVDELNLEQRSVAVASESNSIKCNKSNDVALKLEMRNRILTYLDLEEKTETLKYASAPTPPSSPQETSSTEVRSKWKQMLNNYDKVSKKRKKVTTTLKRKNESKKCKFTLESPPKVEIDIAALSVQNFTEQLLALELIKDFLDNE